MSYCPPYKNSSNNIKVELDLSNYATKDDVKNITHVNVSIYATKTNLAALKTEVDKIDIDRLKTTPTDVAKLSNIVKNDVVKKIDYNEDFNAIVMKILLVRWVVIKDIHGIQVLLNVSVRCGVN